MSITPVPISIRLVLTPIAASSGNGEASCRAKWWTRTNAPSMPSSSAATASSTVWWRASLPVWVSPPPGCQAPNDRNPMRFGCFISTVRTSLLSQVFRTGGVGPSAREPGRDQLLDQRLRQRAVDREVQRALRAGVAGQLGLQLPQHGAAERQVAEVVLDRREPGH